MGMAIPLRYLKHRASLKVSKARTFRWDELPELALIFWTLGLKVSNKPLDGRAVGWLLGPPSILGNYFPSMKLPAIKMERGIIRKFKFMASPHLISVCNVSVPICTVVLINALANYNRIPVALDFTSTWIPKQFSMIHILTMSIIGINSEHVT